MDRLRVKSTSRSSAECSDVVLRETGTTRLVFRPMLVENKSDPAAAVKGVFLFQRKGQKDEWEDTQTIPLSKLKKDEGYRLDLRSSELLCLYDSLSDLYELYAQTGIPRGVGDFVRVDHRLAALTRMSTTDLRLVLAANDAIGSQLFAQLLAWAIDSDEPTALVKRLVTLSPTNLQTLNVAVNLQIMKSVLAIWKDDSSSSDEEFWQRELTKSSFVLEHVFASPVTVVKGKAYVGGKSVQDTGGKLVDLLMRNRVTRNAALIEIKTPATPLLAPTEYRQGVFAPSHDLAGSVTQILNYKHSLQRDYDSITHRQPDLFDAFDPRCVVIIGNAQKELQDDDKRKSFELFRAQCTGVVVITFDELFSRTAQLVDLLGSSAPRRSVRSSEVPAPPDGDVPF